MVRMPCRLPAFALAASVLALVPRAAQSSMDRPNASRADTLPWAAIVDAKHPGAPVAPDRANVPTYRSLGEALTGLTANGGARTVIYRRNGRYRETLTIDRPRIALRGESRSGVVLTFDAIADTQRRCE